MKPWHVLLYLVVLCVIDFILMGVDKRRAKRDQWRIQEKTFFLVALLGGSLGAILGMQTFRHKTKHWYFRYGMPAIFLVQFALCAVGLYWYYFVR